MEPRKYQSIIELIVCSEAKHKGDFAETSALSTKLLRQHLQLSGTSIWLLSPCQTKLNLIAHNGPLSVSESSDVIPLSEYPDYLNLLKSSRHIDVADAKQDERVAELRNRYLEPFNIGSLLDIPIRINGSLEGILNLERVDIQKDWTDTEISIACQVADQLALTLATQQSYRKDELLSFFQSAVDQSDQVTMLFNLKNEVVEFVNEAYANLTGLPIKSFLNKSIWNLILFKQKPEYGMAHLNKLKQGETVRDVVELKRPDGTAIWAKFCSRPFLTNTNERLVLVSIDDYTSQQQAKQELERRAWRCNLTGLYNRFHFTNELEKTKSGNLVLIDIIGFKHFNDTYGHSRGDFLLRETARRMKHFSEANLAKEIARVGSDEFAVLLTETHSVEELESFANKLYHHLMHPIQIDRESIAIKPAIAVVDIASVINSLSPLASADIAIQHAKKKQSKRIQFFNAALLSAFKEDSNIEHDLHYAIRGRQFELYYQPLMDLESQAYTGAEALIRWHHPQKGVLYPGSFIDIAEQTGLINLIGSWVLESACRQLNLWQRFNSDMTMHVNVSARQFFSGNLFNEVWELLTRYKIKPSSLILEITETELMEDIRHATSLCNELSELGVGLAIDDFGTGYSSMRYLKQFPITKLKIDRSFITDIDSSKESREIVSAIIAMAKALNLSLTAEGVETKEQEFFLSKQNCNQAQGFLYSPALREADFNEFLASSMNEIQGEAIH
ncbi:EAL domain-containing protein [Parashewanella spongiae]|uniref:EAL domain-containing protein n=1 Tax=Parashewanella spongiae TaxID=342950 RepID=A0A3A6TYT9_9GAMM|nr:EAL domain-containing protein [Parashewanella spongiae]MCL1077544.1 EAL domain-containing protein [Parashewanella spongiae]RJY18284.1 EAL domain-containing protein [Parashewanella spongiae]